MNNLNVKLIDFIHKYSTFLFKKNVLYQQALQ